MSAAVASRPANGRLPGRFIGLLVVSGTLPAPAPHEGHRGRTTAAAGAIPDGTTYKTYTTYKT